MHLLHLTGSPRQRGQTHGEELRASIASILDLWKADIEKDSHLPASEYLARFHASTSFLPAIEQWAPDLLEEVRGLAEGANQDFQLMLAFQCMDEDWWFRQTGREHCSTIGIQADGSAPILAQNMDIHCMTDGHQILLHISDGDLQSYVFSFAGFIGLTGLNNHPLGVCVNTLSQLNHAPDGLPVAFVLRVLLKQPNVDQAKAFLQRIKHASGQNYMIGDAEIIRDLEASASGTVSYDPPVNNLCHTNHSLTSTDFRPGEKEKAALAFATNSHQRLNIISSAAQSEQPTAASVKAALRTKPVCREVEPGNDFFTSGSLVMTLSARPALDLTFGPPTQSEYQTFEF